MNVGIDWVSTAIFIAAYLFAQVRTVPMKLRYGVLAGACVLIALFRLRGGAQGLNLVFVGIAGGLAVYYAVKAMKVPR
jgi:hypothetical protein